MKLYAKNVVQPNPSAIWLAESSLIKRNGAQDMFCVWPSAKRRMIWNLIKTNYELLRNTRRLDLSLTHLT